MGDPERVLRGNDASSQIFAYNHGTQGRWCGRTTRLLESFARRERRFFEIYKRQSNAGGPWWSQGVYSILAKSRRARSTTLRTAVSTPSRDAVGRSKRF